MAYTPDVMARRGQKTEGGKGKHRGSHSGAEGARSCRRRGRHRPSHVQAFLRYPAHPAVVILPIGAVQLQQPGVGGGVRPGREFIFQGDANQARGTRY